MLLEEAVAVGEAGTEEWAGDSEGADVEEAEDVAEQEKKRDEVAAMGQRDMDLGRKSFGR